jgi:ABC-type multidrug transport system fused ATPase/permease subunit
MESGVNLSGGERQRIMMARAFLMSTDIIILDEATSSVDFESETQIMNAVNTMSAKHNITIIIIAHRVSTIKNVDHLIILNKGELINQGSPKKLKYDQNWYKRMLESDEGI